MKKSHIALTLAATIAASASFAAIKPADKTVMSIGPEKVSLAEFEYLFNKNNQQQATATSLDDYIDMFVDYKLKVLAAKDAGYDTLSSYRSDMEKYTNELARPYLRTEAVDDSLINVAYDHLREMVDVDHILIPSSGPGVDRLKQRELADSIHDALVAGGDFAELAAKYSIDKAAAKRGGHLGFVVGGMWPYTFEDLAFNTPVGSISPVKESRYGFHIIKVNSRKPNPGMVKARHILKSTRDMDETAQANQRKVVDSLLTILRAGADFAETARANTDEPQGKQSGGELPWFSTGQMVQEFNDAAFALQPGQISEPVKTAFGWHIILCEGRKGVQPLDSIRAELETAVKNDERGNLAVKRTIDLWKGQQGLTIDNNEVNKAIQALTTPSTTPAEALPTLEQSNAVLATLGNEKITTGQVAGSFRFDADVKADVATESFRSALDNFIDKTALKQYIASLETTDTDYRNLINEYRDGMLLYEVSNAEIWDKANADTLGLQRFYEDHMSDYRWDRPHYKGFIIAATTDSLANAATEFLSNGTNGAMPSQKEIRKRYGTNVKLERVLAGKGDNAVVDHLCFGAKKPEINSRWKHYRTFGGKIIDQPENASDVKGQVSLAYQQQLEKQWLKSLHKRYKVKVDKKAIRKALGQ